MQRNKSGKYYNIDFEKDINFNELKDIFVEIFPYSNILITVDDENFEHIYDIGDKVNIWFSLTHLTTNEMYIFNDVRLRGLLYIDANLEVPSPSFMILLHKISQQLDSKVFICMEDIEDATGTFIKYCVWCVDHDMRSIMFDLTEFSDNSSNHYSSYLLSK